MQPEQEEELEVLKSIYEGDFNFNLISNTTFQYKYGEPGDNRSYLVELTWGPAYPAEPPVINLDLFYNKHLLSSVKEKIQTGLEEQAKLNLGMSMSFTLFEWLKEAQEELLAEQPAEAVASSNCEDSVAIEQLQIDDQTKKKKEHLTKAQKRRMWDRQNAAGERPRGWDWVDIIKHLSQTGNSSQNNG